MAVEIKIKGKESATAARRCLLSILNNTKLCSVATANADKSPYINTAFFAFDSEFRLFILSETSTQHSRNLQLESKAAITVFETDQEWGGPLAGVQLFGHMGMVDDKLYATAQTVYGERFASYREWIDSLTDEEKAAADSRFYLFIPYAFKMLYDAEFGEEHYVEGTITR